MEEKKKEEVKVEEKKKEEVKVEEKKKEEVKVEEKKVTEKKKVEEKKVEEKKKEEVKVEEKKVVEKKKEEEKKVEAKKPKVFFEEFSATMTLFYASELKGGRTRRISKMAFYECFTCNFPTNTLISDYIATQTKTK